MGLSLRLSHSQRVSLAVLITMLAVGALEVAHFSSGTSVLLEVGYFAIPAVVAVTFFSTLRERVVAFVMLTLVGFLAVAGTVFFYLTH
jgi:putative effector of murein hydrolase LrgA (UPF0299 family)